MTHPSMNRTRGPLPIESENGRVLAPGERAGIDPKSDHDKALEEEGKLLKLPPSAVEPAKTPTKKKEG